MRFNAEFVQNVAILGGLGEPILSTFGTNHCKKSGCLKTGQRLDLGMGLGVP